MTGKGENGLVEGVDPELLEESAEDLFENAPCGYLSTSPGGTVVRVNQTFLDWTGFSRREIIGRKRFSDMLSVGGRMYYETHYAPLLQMQGSVREIAVDLVCADGNTFPVLLSSTLKNDESGKPAVIRTTVFSARDRRQYERELLAARKRAEESESRARILSQTLQKSFLPPALPEVPGLDVGGVYRPAGEGDEVGGDFYDVFENSHGDWAVILGDVAGKGAEAAGITALARYTVRAAAMKTRDPRLVLEMLNRALLQQEASRYCTAVLCRVHQTGHRAFRAVLAVGGHPLPLLSREGEEPIQVGRTGTLLGSFEDPDLTDVTLDLIPGDVLLFYTDGVVEGRHEDGEFFGDERLQRSLALCRKNNAREITAGIAGELVDFQGGLPRDDIALVAVKVP